jgi:hypothetical protein
VARRTAQTPPGIDVKEHSEQEILKRSVFGWKMIIDVVLIIGLAATCCWLAVELRKEKQKHENCLQKWVNEKEKYGEKFNAILKVDKSTETDEISLLERKRKLEEDFEIMKKDVEDEYLKRKTTWEADLKFLKDEISKLEESNSQLHMSLQEYQTMNHQLTSIEHILHGILNFEGNIYEIGLEAANIAVSNGYAYGLEKINDALPETRSISDIDILNLIPIASSSNQVSFMTTLLELPIRKEEFITEQAEIKCNNHGQYYDVIFYKLFRASKTIIDIGDPEIAKIFYRNYAPHIVKLEWIRSGKNLVVQIAFLVLRQTEHYMKKSGRL